MTGNSEASAKLGGAVVRWHRALEPEVAADSERSSLRSSSRQTFDLDQIPPLLRRRISDATQSLEEVREAVQARWRRGLAKRRADHRGADDSPQRLTV
jgi:hypothetical protein